MDNLESARQLRDRFEEVSVAWIKEHDGDRKCFGILNSVLVTFMMSNMSEMVGNESALRMCNTLIKQAYKVCVDGGVIQNYMDDDGNLRDAPST